MIQYLCEKPPGISNFDSLGWTIVHTIAYAVHPDITSQATIDTFNTLKSVFTQNQSSLFKIDNSGNLPIHLASQINNSSILKIMIDVIQQESPTKLNTMLNKARKDKYWQQTPLIIAIKNNSVNCIKILCQQDDIIDSILHTKARYPSCNGLEFALHHNNIDIFKLLLKCIANREKKADLIELKSQLLDIASKTGNSMNLYAEHKCMNFVEMLLQSISQIDDNFSFNLLSLLENVSFDDSNIFGAEKFIIKLNELCRYGHKLKTTYKFWTKCSFCSDNAKYICNSCTQMAYCPLCASAETIWRSIAQMKNNDKNTIDVVSRFINQQQELVKRVKSLTCVLFHSLPLTMIIQHFVVFLCYY